MIKLPPLPEPKKYFGVDAEPDFTYYTAGQMREYSDAENATLTEQVRVLREALEYVLLDEPTGIPRASSACRRVVALALLELTK